MIKRIYKRVKLAVDGVSLAQKIIAFLIWLLSMSLAGNFYQQGMINEKNNPSEPLLCENTRIIEKPVFVKQPPQIIEKTTVIKDCSPKDVKKHEKEWHNAHT